MQKYESQKKYLHNWAAPLTEAKIHILEFTLALIMVYDN